jgi:hypothetical protein
MDMQSILVPIDIFYSRLVYFVVIWYLLPVLVYCAKKNLATLQCTADDCANFAAELKVFRVSKLKKAAIMISY